MPIGTPALAVANAGATATSATTASFTPTEGDLLIAFAAARTSAGEIPTVSDSIGSTWTQIPTAGTEIGHINANLYYQIIGASPAARTVTASSVSAVQVGISVIAISGADVSSNFQVETAAAGDPTVTMAAFDPSSICIGLITTNSGANYASPSGYTEIYDSTVATNLRMSVCYDMSSPSTTMFWDGNAADTIAYGLEITEASGGGSHDLTSLDIANAPSIETPVIGQTNGLTSLNLSSATSIQTASLSQEQALQAAGITSSPVIGQPSVTQTHALTALDIANAPFITQPLIETGIAGYIKLRNAIRLARRKAVRVIFLDEMWDDDNPVE